MFVSAGSEIARQSLKLPDNLFNKLKSKKGILLLCVIGLIGLIFVLIPTQNNSDGGISNGGQTLPEYKAELEGELVNMCERVSGVGRCRVMVTFERGEENTYKGSLLTESKPPRVLGVTVICTGGDSQSVKGALTEMLCALFDIGANRVAIMKLEN